MFQRSRFLKWLSLASLIVSIGQIWHHQVFAQITQRETLYVDDGDGAPFYVETGTTWATSTIGWNGTHRYVLLDDPQNLGQTARWTPDLATQGYYHISFYLPPTSSARNHALYIVSPAGASADSSWHNQNDNSGHFISLGVFLLDSGMGSFVEAVNDSTSTSGYVFRADATRYILGTNERDIEPGRRNAYDFGEVALMSSKDWVLRLYNIGGQDLTIDEISFGTGAYSLFDPVLPIIIPARQHADVTIRFWPYAEQTFDDLMTIHSDDPDEPAIGLALTGIGVEQCVVVNNDDGAPGYTEPVGEWVTSNGIANCTGIPNTTSRYSIQSINPGATATFTPDIPIDGLYRIYYAGPLTANASDHALCIIRPSGQSPDSVWFDQNTDLACDWKLLGTYHLMAGTDNNVSLINDGTGTGYVLRADLMKFTFAPKDTLPIIHLPIDHHTFTDVPIDETEQWSFHIDNIGYSELTISDIINTNPVSFVLIEPSAFPVIIPGQDNIVATVRFQPTFIDSFKAILWIVSDAANEDTSGVYLNGNSIDITPPEAIDDLTAELIARLDWAGKSYWGHIHLSWTEPHDDLGVDHYIVYRSTQPVEQGESLNTTADTTYLDIGSVGNPIFNYYYTVKAVDAFQNRSGPSNQVGEFDRPWSPAE